MKKGQGVSITTIIVAAIALIVLVVLIAIFTGRLGGFETGLTSEEQAGRVQAAALASDGNVTAGNACWGIADATCKSPGTCAYDNLQNRPVTATKLNTCQQGLVCCK